MSQTKQTRKRDAAANRTSHNRRRQGASEHTRNNNKRRFSRAYYERRRKMRNKRIAVLACMALAAVGILCLGIICVRAIIGDAAGQEGGAGASSQKVSFDGDINKMSVPAPAIDVDLLTVNEYSRPGTKLEQVNGIVIHYVGNPKTTAAQNRSYFENLKDSHATSASSHFVIGLEGEIIQCIPTSEVAYTSNERNYDTVSIECCHPKKDGKFTDETYDSLVELTAFLCCKYSLDMENIIRHYDITGKECPKYYVDHEDEWVQFKKDVAAYIKKNGTES